MKRKSSFWYDKRVLVTGATGMVGSGLTESLIQKGAELTILKRDFVPKSELINSKVINKVNIVRGNLEDYMLIKRALNEYEIELVFHLGAQTIVPLANRSPISTFESNIKGTWNVLEAVRNSNWVDGIVIASSDKAYGSQEKLPYNEDAPLKGQYMYDVTKSCADLISQAYYNTYKLPIGIARCGNIYGPGDLNFSRLIPGTIKSLILNQRPIIRSDGNFIRDYIFLEDILDAYIILAQNLNKKQIQGQAFNFSTKNKMKVIEIVQLITNLMNSKLKPIILNEAKGEIKDQYLNSEKASKLLKWSAKHNLKEGIKKTIPWYQRLFKR